MGLARQETTKSTSPCNVRYATAANSAKRALSGDCEQIAHPGTTLYEIRHMEEMGGQWLDSHLHLREVQPGRRCLSGRANTQTLLSTGMEASFACSNVSMIRTIMICTKDSGARRCCASPPSRAAPIVCPLAASGASGAPRCTLPYAPSTPCLRS